MNTISKIILLVLSGSLIVGCGSLQADRYNYQAHTLQKGEKFSALLDRYYQEYGYDQYYTSKDAFFQELVHWNPHIADFDNIQDGAKINFIRPLSPYLPYFEDQRAGGGFLSLPPKTYPKKKNPFNSTPPVLDEKTPTSSQNWKDKAKDFFKKGQYTVGTKYYQNSIEESFQQGTSIDSTQYPSIVLTASGHFPMKRRNITAYTEFQYHSLESSGLDSGTKTFDFDDLWTVRFGAIMPRKFKKHSPFLEIEREIFSYASADDNSVILQSTLTSQVDTKTNKTWWLKGGAEYELPQWKFKKESVLTYYLGLSLLEKKEFQSSETSPKSFKSYMVGTTYSFNPHHDFWYDVFYEYLSNSNITSLTRHKIGASVKYRF